MLCAPRRKARRTPRDNSPAFAVVQLLLRHRHEDQHGDDRDQEAERARSAVPLLGLPHPEPLAADRHEADLPQQEAEGEPNDGHGLGAVECGSTGSDPARQHGNADPAKRGDRDLGRDDRPVGELLQRGIGDRTIFDGGERVDRVHRQHMLHEGEIGVVVGDVPERDEAREEGDGRDQHYLCQAQSDHGAAEPCAVKPWGGFERSIGYFGNRAIASSASTPPVIAIGAKVALAATSALGTMI